MAKKNHQSKRFTMVVCPYPFFVRDGKILLARRRNTEYMPGMYSVPAGHEEDGERLLACLLREVNEEVGITFFPKDAQLVHVMHRREEDVRMDLFFLISKWHGEPHIREPDKCDDLSWFPLSGLPDKTVPYIRKAIENWRNDILYDEFGWSE